MLETVRNNIIIVYQLAVSMPCMMSTEGRSTANLCDFVTGECLLLNIVGKTGRGQTMLYFTLPAHLKAFFLFSSVYKAIPCVDAAVTAAC